MFLNVLAASWDIREFYHLMPTMFGKISTCWMKDTLILAQLHSHLQKRPHAIRFTGINIPWCIYFSSPSAAPSAVLPCNDLTLHSYLQNRPHAVRFTHINNSWCLFFSSLNAAPQPPSSPPTVFPCNDLIPPWSRTFYSWNSDTFPEVGWKLFL